MPSTVLPPLALPDAVAQQAVDMARASLPNEACGLVAGPTPLDWTRPDPITVMSVVPVRNALAAPDAFSLDGQGMIDAETAIDAAGHSPIGVYHSHPATEARPSPRDVLDAVGYDPNHQFVHLIVSLQGFAPTVRAWRLGPSPDESVELRLVASP